MNGNIFDGTELIAGNLKVQINEAHEPGCLIHWFGECEVGGFLEKFQAKGMYRLD